MPKSFATLSETRSGFQQLGSAAIANVSTRWSCLPGTRSFAVALRMVSGLRGIVTIRYNPPSIRVCMIKRWVIPPVARPNIHETRCRGSVPTQIFVDGAEHAIRTYNGDPPPLGFAGLRPNRHIRGRGRSPPRRSTMVSNQLCSRHASLLQQLRWMNTITHCSTDAFSSFHFSDPLHVTDRIGRP